MLHATCYLLPGADVAVTLEDTAVAGYVAVAFDIIAAAATIAVLNAFAAVFAADITAVAPVLLLFCCSFSSILFATFLTPALSHYMNIIFRK
jgi:hypothetical protein